MNDPLPAKNYPTLFLKCVNCRRSKIEFVSAKPKYSSLVFIYTVRKDPRMNAAQEDTSTCATGMRKPI
jgi:hypothetical protein